MSDADGDRRGRMEVICHHVRAICVATHANEGLPRIERADALGDSTAATVRIAAGLALKVDQRAPHLSDLRAQVAVQR